MVRSTYAETIRTSLSLPSLRHVQSDPAQKRRSVWLRRGTALTLVGLLAVLIVAVVIQLIQNR